MFSRDPDVSGTLQQNLQLYTDALKQANIMLQNEWISHFSNRSLPLKSKTA